MQNGGGKVLRTVSITFFVKQVLYDCGSQLVLFCDGCRCVAGYYGDPIIGSGDHCRPCPCPDGPGSGRQFAGSCYQDPVTLQLACVCEQGYIGKSRAHLMRKKNEVRRKPVYLPYRSFIKSQGTLTYRYLCFPFGLSRQSPSLGLSGIVMV